MTARLLTLTLLLAPLIASAQQPDWHAGSIANLSASITTLSPADQKGIEQVVHQPPESLHALRVDTPSTHLFLIQASDDKSCDVRRNCAAWIISSDYRVLLNTSTPHFKIQTTLHAGLPDLLTSDAGFNDTGTFQQWRFDGTTYRLSACATYTSHDSFNDTYGSPRTTPYPCPTN
ncbi:MAG: hypothetical protein WB439_04830 [Acidobacteriaceae bacterium]